MPLTRRQLVYLCLGVAVIFLAAFTYKSSQSRQGAAAATMAEYQSQCQQWVAREFSDSREAILSRSSMKDGMYVFDFFTPKRKGSSEGYSELCVVDPASGKMMRPGAFGRSKWE